MVVLAVMAAGAHAMTLSAPALAEQDRMAKEAEAAAERSIPPAQADVEDLPVPLVVGGAVLAFAAGLSTAQVRRRRRTTRRLAEARARPAPVATVAAPAAPAPEPPPVVAAPPPPPPTPAPPPPKPVPRPPAAKPEPKAAPKPEPKPEPAPEPEPRAQPEPKPAAVVRPPQPAPESLGATPEARPRPVEPVRPAPPRRSAPPPPPPVDPAAVPARRFARAQPWPEEAASLWTCEIAWKAGYVKSAFRAMGGPPGGSRRQALGESPALRWTLMTDPEPPTPEMLMCVKALVAALQQAGWERIDPGPAWYAQRFLWRGAGEPRPVTVPDPVQGER